MFYVQEQVKKNMSICFFSFQIIFNNSKTINSWKNQYSFVFKKELSISVFFFILYTNVLVYLSVWVCACVCVCGCECAFVHVCNRRN